MQRQAVPLLRSDSPVVGTGREGFAAIDAGDVVTAKRSGVVIEVSADVVAVQTDEGGIDEYFLRKFDRSNQGTSYNQRVIVSAGERIEAGEVIAGIERAGVPYEVRGDSIYVAADQRDRLRMDLAAEGLPAAGSTGYELLDGMSGFGTTSQMFDAAYWRAKEGELARTILALPNVQTARVHLAIETGRGYRRDQNGSASVTLTTNGGTITREQAAALKYLVSSGVPGMQPDRVTVIDSQRGIIAATEDQTGADRAAEMKRNVERILKSLIG